jgi:PEP-CTERM motif
MEVEWQTANYRETGFIDLAPSLKRLAIVNGHAQQAWLGCEVGVLSLRIGSARVEEIYRFSIFGRGRHAKSMICMGGTNAASEVDPVAFVPPNLRNSPMNIRLTIGRSLCAALTALTFSGAHAAVVSWTDWTSVGTNLQSAIGSMGGVSVTVSSGTAMNGVTQITGAGNCGVNYWTEPNALDRPYTGGSVSNAPTPCEQLGMASGNLVTVTFSSAVSNLYMALLSVGQPGLPVTYDFDQAFTIDSEGAGFWGNDVTNGVLGAGDTLTMREFHGVLLFNSPVTSLTFSSTAENWQAFTFGRAATEVPEPSSLLLLGGALCAVAAAARRRQA